MLETEIILKEETKKEIATTIEWSKYAAYISIFGALITLILNFTLIPIMGYYGSAIATIAAYGSMMAISYLLGNRYYPIPYDFKKISGYMGLSILFSIISFYYFRENYFVGVPLLLVFMYFIYHNEKETLNKSKFTTETNKVETNLGSKSLKSILTR
jgi:type III secretory pathway component EscU